METAIVILYLLGWLITVPIMAYWVMNAVGDGYHESDRFDIVSDIFIGILTGSIWPLALLSLLVVAVVRWLINPERIVGKMLMKAPFTVGQKIIFRQSTLIQEQRKLDSERQAYTEKLAADKIKLRQWQNTLQAREDALTEIDRRNLVREQAVNNNWQQPQTNDETEDLTAVLTKPRSSAN